MSATEIQPDTPPSPDQPAPEEESKVQRQRRLGRERFGRWYERHKGEFSVRTLTHSNASDRVRRRAVQALHEVGIDPGEVVALNEVERKVKALEGGQSDLRQQFAHLQKALRGSGSHQWAVGDWVLCPAPFVQGRNRKAVSTTMMVVAYGEIVALNMATKAATVRVAPGQCVNAKLDDMILRRAPGK